MVLEDVDAEQQVALREVRGDLTAVELRNPDEALDRRRQTFEPLILPENSGQLGLHQHVLVVGVDAGLLVG